MCQIPVFKTDKTSGDTVKLYEEIVIKNFDILKSLLPRMNSLYQLNEQLERSVSNIQTRLIKMQNDNQNLHYQMRTSHLAIDTKLNSIIADYNNITNQTTKIKKQAQHLSKEIKEAKSKHSFAKSEKEQTVQLQQQKNKEHTQGRIKKIGFAEKDQVFPNLVKTKPKKQPPKRSSISLENLDSPTQSPKVKFNLQAATERAERGSEKGVIVSAAGIEGTKRKPTFKDSKSSIIGSSANIASKSQRQIKTSKSINPNQGKSFEKFLKQIQNYHFHNQKMKQNYEELMEEYCKTNQINFKDIHEKINQISTKLTNIDSKNSLLQAFKATISFEWEPKFQQIKLRLADKLDKEIFDKIISDFNTRIIGIHQQRKKIANKDQTKRALEFLQKKINGVLNDYYEAKQKSVHHVTVDRKGCLRAADMIGQRNKNEYSRESLIQLQTINNTQRTIRNESAHSSKRQAASLHGRLTQGRTTENRFNQGEWRSIITQKGDSLQDVPTHRKQQANKKINLLNKKAYQILGKQKAKERPKLKKQRLIFQYD